jgi:tRNA modification GTPase
MAGLFVFHPGVFYIISPPPMKYAEDTIAAIATPIGEGGISVIRLSGTDALRVADACFKGKKTLQQAASHTAHFGEIRDEEDSLVDEVVATVFRAPNSYTREDVVEVSCHGGVFITRKILETLLAKGARMADPGEFTKRAFLNGRIDLSQAEAVADLIRSCSTLAHRSSLSQLRGTLSDKIQAFRDALLRVVSLLELELDFFEEGLELSEKSGILSEIEEISGALKDLIGSYQSGRVFREGVRVVLVGKPNVGKSSILNALLSEDRSIVTSIPGTTRDTIEESLTVDGLLLRIVDTAGLRETRHPVEHEGVRRTEREIQEADISMLILDVSQGFTSEDELIFDRSLSKQLHEENTCIVVFNKIDLLSNISNLRIPEKLLKHDIVYVSAKTGSGMDQLRKELFTKAMEGGKHYGEKSLVLTNARHRDVLLRTQQSLERAEKALKESQSNEFIVVDLRGALDQLGEIVGIVTTDDILNSIFSRFCVGK